MTPEEYLKSVIRKYKNLTRSTQTRINAEMNSYKGKMGIEKYVSDKDDEENSTKAQERVARIDKVSAEEDVEQRANPFSFSFKGSGERRTGYSIQRKGRKGNKPRGTGQVGDRRDPKK